MQIAIKRRLRFRAGSSFGRDQQISGFKQPTGCLGRGRVQPQHGWPEARGEAQGSAGIACARPIPKDDQQVSVANDDAAGGLAAAIGLISLGGVKVKTACCLGDQRVRAGIPPMRKRQMQIIAGRVSNLSDHALSVAGLIGQGNKAAHPGWWRRLIGVAMRLGGDARNRCSDLIEQRAQRGLQQGGLPRVQRTGHEQADAERTARRGDGGGVVSHGS